MDMFEDNYQERPITIINIHDHDIEIIKPDSVILKFESNTKAGSSHYDIGSLCFRLRRSRHAGIIQDINQIARITEVVLNSKEDWRVYLIASIIEHIRTQAIFKSVPTIKNITKTIFLFFQFCEGYIDFNNRSQTFEGFLSIYREFTDELRYRSKLSPNNKLFKNRSSAASEQRIVRRFIQHHFDMTEIDIIRHVPSLSKGRDKPSIVSALGADIRDEFIRFSFLLFHGLANGILNQDYAPIKLILPVREKEIIHIYLGVSSCADVIINSDLTWPSFLNDEVDLLIEEHRANSDLDVHKHRQLVRKATNQAKSHRSLITPSHCLSKTYILAQSAFIACFYAATGINPTVLTNLEVTSEIPKTNRGMRFSGLKARAGNITVYPEFGNHFLHAFNKFKEIRTYVSNHFGYKSLWFFRPASHLTALDPEATLLPLKNFIKSNNFDIPILTPTQIRKGLAVDFLKLSRGDLIITSNKLGNSINTVAANYTANDPLEQSREFSDFYKKMFQSAIIRAKPNGGLIGVLDATDKDFKTPAGHCSNTQRKEPDRIAAFSEFAPQPDCSRPETCLFCRHYSIVSDKDDISKLLGLKELIKLVKTNVGVSDKYINFLAPVFDRISEILNFMRNAHPQTEYIIAEVQAEIEQGLMHPFWEEHYEFLLELGM